MAIKHYYHIYDVMYLTYKYMYKPFGIQAIENSAIYLYTSIWTYVFPHYYGEIIFKLGRNMQQIFTS